MTRKSDDLERRVLSELAASDRGPLKTKELARALEIPASDYRRFRRLLTGLERSGKIYRVKGHRYAVASTIDLVTGTLSVTRAGDGFVRPDQGGEDLFIPAQRLATDVKQAPLQAKTSHNEIFWQFSYSQNQERL